MALMQRALADARERGHRLVILVGDEPYYARVGFKRVPRGRVKMPGPVDPARLLVAELVDGAFEGVRGRGQAGLGGGVVALTVLAHGRRRPT